MKIMLSSRRHHYLARVIIFLIMVVLIAGMAGCNPFCTLTIDSTEGGSVTVPGEGTFIYFVSQCGPTQDLVAEADEGYRFVRWTGYVNNPDTAITCIQICRHESVTAHFEPK
ncbi:MAG: InlB B-repeat-containing protein [Chloroflexota bacterium]